MTHVTVGIFALLALAVLSSFSNTDSVPIAFSIFMLVSAFCVTMLRVSSEGAHLRHTGFYQAVYAVSGITFLLLFLAEQFLDLRALKEVMALR